MDKYPGLGVMIDMLAGRGKTGEAVRSALNKTIAAIALDDDRLVITFTDDTALQLWDNGQSCCESRYMRTDDDLSAFTGAVFTGTEVRDAPTEKADDGYGDHEVQFLVIETSKGSFTMASHVEHNGDYGGFSINASLGAVEKRD